MDYRFVKVNSVQGGNYSQSNRLIDIDIPEGNAYDLSKSYVDILIANIDVTNPGANQVSNLEMVLKNSAGGSNNNLSFENSIIVKNCSLTSAMKGSLENRRRNDLFRMTMFPFLQYDSSFECLSYKRFNQVSNHPSTRKYSPFLDTKKIGTNASSYRDETPMRIPMNHLFSLGNTVLRTDKCGRTRIHLEIEPQRMVLQSFSTSIPTTTFSAAGSGVADATAIVSIKTDTQYSNLEDSQFFVGQGVQLTSASTVVTGTKNPVVISKIEQESDNKLTLTFSSSLGTAVAAVAGTTVIIEEVAATAASFDFSRCEMTLKLLLNPPKAAGTTYTTIQTEEDTHNDLASLSKIYQLEPNCTNMYLTLPDPSQEYFSKLPVEEYRITVDNLELTDRPIKMYNPIYYDQVLRTFNNASLPFRSLNFKNRSNAANKSSDATYSDGQTNLLIATPLNQTPGFKLVQLDLTPVSGSKINSVVLFKEVVRTLKY